MAEINVDIEIVSGGSSSQLLDGQCEEDSEGVTHCVIENDNGK